jgi:hypothetical protein
LPSGKRKVRNFTFYPILAMDRNYFLSFFFAFVVEVITAAVVGTSRIVALTAV